MLPYHPECASSRLVSEAKQGQAWLVLGCEDNSILDLNDKIIHENILHS